MDALSGAAFFPALELYLMQIKIPFINKAIRKDITSAMEKVKNEISTD